MTLAHSDNSAVTAGDAHHRRQPIRVLHVLGSLNVGGAEMRMLDIARRVDRDRFAMHFGLLSGREGELADEFRAAGATIHLLPIGLRFARLFRSALDELHIDVVHSHVHFASGYVLRHAARAGITLRIAHFRSRHDGRANSLRRRLQRRLMRHWMERHATHILACNCSVMHSNWGADWETDERCRVVYNGIDPSSFACPPDRLGVAREFGLSPESPLYIHVGNIRPPKAHRRLVSIFARVVRDEPTANLLLVGRGGNELERDLRTLAERLGIADRVIFAGLRTDVPRLLRAADVMVYPSLWEGLPGAVLEASAAGTPVLASDLPEIREVADHFSNVRLLPLSADDDQWAAAASALLRECEQDRSSIRSMREFDASPFRLCTSIESLCQLWEQARPLGPKTFQDRVA